MGHLTKWVFFNLLCGAIPYALTVALNQLQFPGTPLLHPSSEVLFIAVVATSSALGELWDGDAYPSAYHSPPGRRGIEQLMLLFGVLSSSVLYGAYVYATLSSPGRVGGIDCSAVAAIGAGVVPRESRVAELMVRWSSTCAPWARTQALFFRYSLWLTAFSVLASTAAMARNRPRRW